MAKQMYQNIVLELDDGRLISATVPAFCHIGDKVSVRNIRVTNPERLPADCSFEDVEYEKGKDNVLCDHEWESVSAVKCEKCGMIIED